METNKERRKCTNCGRSYPLESFRVFWVKKNQRFVTQSYCAKCKAKIQREKAQDKRNGLPCEKVPSEPHTYNSEDQKQQTYQFLQKLGWNFNEKTGRWYKIPLTNKDGKWNIKNEKN